MANNSRQQHSRDRQTNRGDEGERSRRDNRQNTTRDANENENTERSNERNDRIFSAVPDNYERDSE